MSQTKHTPCPWELNGNAIEGGNMHLASLLDERDIPIDSFEVSANGRLMAAAPDLLQSLKWAMQIIGPYTRRIKGQNEAYCDAHDKAMAAIAKAEGRAK